MDLAQRPRGARSAGAFSARILLALAALAAALTLTVVGADPAGAYTIVRSPDQIVITSDRLSENQTHVTVIATLHSNGDYDIYVRAHCTAAYRKWVRAFATVRSPAVDRFWPLDTYTNRRVDSGEWDEWGYYGGNDPLLAQRWDEVVNDPNLSASLSMRVSRTVGGGG